ncbi:MAG: antibiotic biosynthesis monooxygenase [Chitinophagaceae bacterium]|nr:antibiotic biosynthesis monooxygenase [Chitinophagaceae bacterium]
MIKRIVQMTFEPQHIETFRQFFEERKATIKGFEGCTFLELWQDVHHPQIFFTHSIWDSEHHLNQYRFSDFFKDTWQQTKAMFAEKPQAWSVAVQ